MITGDMPFTGVNDLILYDKIKKGKYTFPDNKIISPECISLINSMLKTNPRERLSAEDVLSHPWFQGKLYPGPTVGFDLNRMYKFSKLDKLQKLVIIYMATHISDSNLILYMNSFIRINTIKVGVIRKEE